MSSITASKHARSPNRRSLLLTLAVLGVALTLLLLDLRGFLGPAKGAAQAILRPTEQRLTQSRLGVGQWFTDLLHVGALRSRNAALEAQLSAQQARLVQLEALQATNDSLTRQLGLRQAYDWNTVSATVVQGSADNGRRFIRISRGRVDGLAIGMAVVGKEGGSPPSLVGIVDRVYAQTADVVLITDGTFSISARTTGQVVATGLAVGQWQLGSRVRLENVDRDAPLAPGDTVVTAGLSKPLATDTPLAQVPMGIPLGVVGRVLATNYDKSAELLPFVDPDRVRDVWVITSKLAK